MKKYVPFDLSLPEDREAVKNLWVRGIGCTDEFPVLAISMKSLLINNSYVSPLYMLRNYTNARTGEPCGKLVEVEND